MPPFWQPQNAADRDQALESTSTPPTGRSIRDSFIGWTNGRTLNVETSTNAISPWLRIPRHQRGRPRHLLGINRNALREQPRQRRPQLGDRPHLRQRHIRNNTIDSVGDGVGQSGGIRAFGPGSTRRPQCVLNNAGPAIAVNGTMTAPPRVAGEVVITRNQFHPTTIGLAIDLMPPARTTCSPVTASRQTTGAQPTRVTGIRNSTSR